MLYSRGWQYGMRILFALAALEPEERLSAARVSRRSGVPGPFASKILARLAAANLVRSRRGPGGGVSLARPAAEIRVEDVVRALGEESLIGHCVLGFSECNDRVPCPLHPLWGSLRETLRGALLERSLAELSSVATASVRAPRRTARRA
jgi:Rrf2 family protein